MTKTTAKPEFLANLLLLTAVLFAVAVTLALPSCSGRIVVPTAPDTVVVRDTVLVPDTVFVPAPHKRPGCR